MGLFSAKKPPKAPTAAQLYSGPEAQWGQFNPNLPQTPTAPVTPTGPTQAILSLIHI